MFVKSILPEEIEKLPRATFPGSIEVIDKEDANYYAAIEYLLSKTLVGFDTESRPSFSPNQPQYGISLLQLSSGERAFLFRIKRLGLTEELCRILSDPKIIKVGAAVTDDIRGLQRYSQFTSGGFVDLQKIVWEWGIKDKSVKKMAAIILGVKVSKTQQLSNWEAERLSESQKMYAATDSWICEMMYSALGDAPKNPLSPEELNPNRPAENKDSENGKLKNLVYGYDLEQDKDLTQEGGMMELEKKDPFYRRFISAVEEDKRRQKAKSKSKSRKPFRRKKDSPIVPAAIPDNNNSQVQVEVAPSVKKAPSAKKKASAKGETAISGSHANVKKDIPAKKKSTGKKPSPSKEKEGKKTGKPSTGSPDSEGRKRKSTKPSGKKSTSSESKPKSDKD